MGFPLDRGDLERAVCFREDLYKLESKPVVLFQAANLCREEGNARLKDGKASTALAKYEEGLYIIDKCREASIH